jgi:hypothetical protein
MLFTSSDSIVMDFIRPLPPNNGFDSILSITDCLHSDICIIPTCTNITAEELAIIFFDNWYCENGLPLEIISDWDKLFDSEFWHALHKLTGVKLKLSSSYHPQMDGSSEHSNKTINQSIRYHVQHNQKGWVRALLRICFNIMNVVNASTNFSPFQLCLGRLPHLIPPIVPDNLEALLSPEGIDANQIISQIALNVEQAKDNLLQAKIFQVHYANQHHGPEPKFEVNDMVMLSTLHCCNEYKKKGEKCVAKLFPCYDGPYVIIKTHPEASTYTLHLPNSLNVYPTYHASKLICHVPNDPVLFPGCENQQPPPIVTPDGVEAYFVDKIIDSCHCSKGWQYLIRWSGYGPEHDWWLSCTVLNDCEALDRWLAAEQASDTR